jgi:hypothetical protein
MRVRISPVYEEYAVVQVQHTGCGLPQFSGHYLVGHFETTFDCHGGARTLSRFDSWLFI